MAIAQNVSPAALGTRVGLADGGVGTVLSPPPPHLLPPPAAPPAPTAVTATVPRSVATLPGVVTLPPTFRPPILVPPILPQPQPAPPKVTTALALAAIDQLNRATPVQVRQALNALASRQLTPDGVMDYLVRKVNIGEVLGQTADHWAATTQSDFADAFQLQLNQPDTFSVMDSIVSIAILNDRDLESELRNEQAPPGTPGDFLQSRRVIWQWPSAGTVLSPPYVILVAVESQDVSSATDAVHSILDQLTAFQGFKLPQTVVQRLG
jgi:hypothetical protein